MAQALLKLLKQQQPETLIDVLAAPFLHSLLATMPEVNECFPMPLGHGQLQLRQRWQYGRRLRANAYQQTIILPNSWKSALVPYAANIPLRTGWLGELRFGLLNDIRYLNKQKLPLMVQRFLALGLTATADASTLDYWRYCPQLVVTDDAIDVALTKLNLKRPQSSIVALCPGAEYGPAKRWPAEYFAEVAQTCLERGQQVWIFGSQKDQGSAAIIQQLTSNCCVDFTGKTTLGEAVALLALADTVISNDSGLMHIAAALQRPLVVIYGSSSPGFTPPLSRRVKILSLQLSCSPCFQRECPLHHLKCLRDLSPELVLNAMATVAI